MIGYVGSFLGSIFRGWRTFARDEAFGALRRVPSARAAFSGSSEHRGYHWERPSLQPVNIEVLHSNERPNITAVFGTAQPPSGLSGWIRRRAFRYGESSYGHWLPLLLADRINVIEGLADDLRRGRLPNLLRERGWRAEWRYNRPAMVRRGLATAAIAAGSCLWLQRDRASDGPFK